MKDSDGSIKDFFDDTAKKGEHTPNNSHVPESILGSPRKRNQGNDHWTDAQVSSIKDLKSKHIY